jgi:hypothetical protein
VNKHKGLVAVAALLTGVGFSTSVLAYGAIAIDDVQPEVVTAYGFSAGAHSKEDAERAAMWDCYEFGNDHCKVAMRFEQCGAYAASGKHHGYGYGRTKAVAVKNALEMCGENSCNVVVAKCE